MKIEKKTILIIGGSSESIPGIIEAKKKFNVILVDKSPEAPGIKYSDFFINESTYNPKKIYNKLFKLKYKINGVISLNSDVPYTVSYIANKLGLNSLSLKSSKILSDKFLMKSFFKKNNINTADFYLINNYSLFREKVKLYKKFVIKPCDSRGARGVFLLKNNSKQLKKYYLKTLKISKKKLLLFEEYLEGPQLSTESIIVDGKCFTIGISDRNYEKLSEYCPSIIEDGSDMPSIFQKDFKKKIDFVMQKVANKLNLKNGTLKGDLLIKNNEIYIIEIAGRLSGGFFSSIMIPNHNNINLIKSALNICLGKKIKKPVIKINRFITQRYLFSKQTGRIKNIKFPEWIKITNKIIFFELNIKKNFYVSKITDHSKRLGQVIVRGKSRKDAVNYAKKIIDSIKIEFY